MWGIPAPHPHATPKPSSNVKVAWLLQYGLAMTDTFTITLLQGLQLGYFLQRTGRDYVIIERAAIADECATTIILYVFNNVCMKHQ